MPIEHGGLCNGYTLIILKKLAFYLTVRFTYSGSFIETVAELE